MADYTTNVASLVKSIVGIGQETVNGGPVTPTIFPHLLTKENSKHLPEYETVQALTGGIAPAAVEMLHIRNSLELAYAFLARPGELLMLLQSTMGNTALTGARSDDATLKTLTMEVSKIHEVLTFAGVRVDTLTLSSEQGQGLLVDVLAYAMSCARGTSATGPGFSTDAVLRHADVVLTVDNSTYAVDKIEIKIVNSLDQDNRQNTVNRLKPAPYGQRIVTCSMDLDWNSTNKTSFLDNIHTATTIAVTAVWSRSSKGLTVSLPKLFLLGDDPVPGARGPWKFPINGQAMASVIGEDDEIALTLDTSA